MGVEMSAGAVFLAADSTDVLFAATAASGGARPANYGLCAQAASGVSFGRHVQTKQPPSCGHAGLANFT